MSKSSMVASLLLAVIASVFIGCKEEMPVGLPVPAPEPDPEPVVDDGRPAPGDYLLPLIETTDLHGYVVDNDNGTIHYRLAYIADKANDIRGKSGEIDKDRLVLLDGGDLYQGAAISNLLDGWPVFAAMDKMGYDAVALGNHEFDWGFDNTVDADATMPDYERSGQRCVNSVPVLCANLYKNGARVSSTSDYVILEKNAVNSAGKTISVKIGVIGFAVNYSSSILASRFADQGYSINENYSIASSIARDLESSGQCDATILLIHGAAENAAGRLGSGTPIDLVLGGHSHTYSSGATSYGVPYLQGGRYGERYAYADLKFNVDAETREISFKSVVNQKILSVDSTRDIHTTPAQNSWELDEEVLAISDEAVDATSQQMNDVIGYITVGASSYTINGSGDRAAVISNWMCDILRSIGDADVAFVNAGGVRTYFSLGGQSRLDITVSNVYEMFPFSNTVYVYNITYGDLLKVFEYSMTYQGQVLFSRMTGMDCCFNGSNIISLKKDGTVIYQNGTWTGDWASYTTVLAVSEYVATTQRIDSATGLKNPLIEWNSTSKLISNDLVDNENAVRVLREEAAASGGHLYIDTAAHFIAQP